MKENDTRILRRRKQKLERRLGRRNFCEQDRPMLAGTNLAYEMAERTRAIGCGGIGAFHLLAQKTGLIRAINDRVHLLKRHLPYHESDHVLNIAYNILAGGTCLDDIERLRTDETYLDAVGAERIPDPTTAGDFMRRFSEADVLELQEAVNDVRVEVWRHQLSPEEREEAVIDMDGTLAPTTGECKAGMDISYKGVWGYHPLLISLANTQEPLYLVNRSGNRPSHDGAVEWIDRAIGRARETFAGVCLRGDTDFALTAQFDRWSEDDVRFAFGIDAMPNLVDIAEELGPHRWRRLRRADRQATTEKPRQRPTNVKAAIVSERGYKNLQLKTEHVAEFDYQPGKCKRSYRVIVLRKQITVSEGQQPLFDETRYLFYITNIEEMSPGELVVFCNGRCQQENLIEQLKNGLNALRMPVGDLVSNGAYMVMAALAWTLKAWFALFTSRSDDRKTLLGMEFRRFLHGIVLVPCQILRTGRRIVYRILGTTEWTRTFLHTFDRIRALRWT